MDFLTKCVVFINFLAHISTWPWFVRKFDYWYHPIFLLFLSFHCSYLFSITDLKVNDYCDKLLVWNYSLTKVTLTERVQAALQSSLFCSWPSFFRKIRLCPRNGSLLHQYAEWLCTAPTSEVVESNIPNVLDWHAPFLSTGDVAHSTADMRVLPSKERCHAQKKNNYRETIHGCNCNVSTQARGLVAEVKRSLELVSLVSLACELFGTRIDRTVHDAQRVRPRPCRRLQSARWPHVLSYMM